MVTPPSLGLRWRSSSHVVDDTIWSSGGCLSGGTDSAWGVPIIGHCDGSITPKAVTKKAAK